MKMNVYYLLLITFLISACHTKSGVPVVGFVDAFEDETIAQARQGFTDALARKGFSEDKQNIEIKYQNAQGDIPTLTQIVNSFTHPPVTLLATCTTLASVTAVQNTSTIPVFVMVSPTPERMKLISGSGKVPANLFGAVEDLNYIDTSFTIIPALVKVSNRKLRVGMVYNQSEPQSADALQRIQQLAKDRNIEIEALPLNSSADAQLVTEALLNKHIDVFFANPDNTVFAAFATILKSCNQRNVPVFTSEAGLVERGAVAAFGADIYQWGYQAGMQAAQYLQTHSTTGLKPELVKIRKRVYNRKVAERYHIQIPANYVDVN